MSHSYTTSTSENKQTSKLDFTFITLKNVYHSSVYVILNTNPSKLVTFKKNLMLPFMDRVQLPQGCWATARRQFFFYHQVPSNFWYSFRPQKDETLSRSSKAGKRLGHGQHWSNHTNKNKGYKSRIYTLTCEPKMIPMIFHRHTLHLT